MNMSPIADAIGFVAECLVRSGVALLACGVTCWVLAICVAIISDFLKKL